MEKQKQWMNENLDWLNKQYEEIKGIVDSSDIEDVNTRLLTCTSVCYNLCGLYSEFQRDYPEELEIVEKLRNSAVLALLAGLKLCSLPGADSKEVMSRFFRGISMCFNTSGKLFLDCLDENGVDTLDDYINLSGVFYPRRRIQLGDNTLLGVYTIDITCGGIEGKRYVFQADIADSSIADLSVAMADYPKHNSEYAFYRVKEEGFNNLLTSLCCDKGSSTDLALNNADFMGEVISPLAIQSLLDRVAGNLGFGVQEVKQK